MLTRLVRGSIRHRGVVLGLAAALVVLGADTLSRAPLDVFPEFAPPQVSIQTEAPGFSPEQVELQVTKPIEDAINGVQGIAAIRSQSIQGLSVVTAVLGEYAPMRAGAAAPAIASSRMMTIRRGSTRSLVAMSGETSRTHGADVSVGGSASWASTATIR